MSWRRSNSAGRNGGFNRNSRDSSANEQQQMPDNGPTSSWFSDMNNNDNFQFNVFPPPGENQSRDSFIQHQNVLIRQPPTYHQPYNPVRPTYNSINQRYSHGQQQLHRSPHTIIPPLTRPIHSAPRMMGIGDNRYSAHSPPYPVRQQPSQYYPEQLRKMQQPQLQRQQRIEIRPKIHQHRRISLPDAPSFHENSIVVESISTRARRGSSLGPANSQTTGESKNLNTVSAKLPSNDNEDDFYDDFDEFCYDRESSFRTNLNYSNHCNNKKLPSFSSLKSTKPANNSIRGPSNNEDSAPTASLNFSTNDQINVRGRESKRSGVKTGTTTSITNTASERCMIDQTTNRIDEIVQEIFEQPTNDRTTESESEIVVTVNEQSRTRLNLPERRQDNISYEDDTSTNFHSSLYASTVVTGDCCSVTSDLTSFSTAWKRQQERQKRYKKHQQQLVQLKDPAYLLQILEEMIPQTLHYQQENKNLFSSNINSMPTRKDARFTRRTRKESERFGIDSKKGYNDYKQSTEYIWDKVRRWIRANDKSKAVSDPLVGEENKEPDEPIKEIYFDINSIEGGNRNNDSSHVASVRLRQCRGDPSATGVSGLYFRGFNEMTPLHWICKIPHPPDDILVSLIDMAPEIVTLCDSFGWLPLHHACANGCSSSALSKLIEPSPSIVLRQDNQGRSPLHFFATKSYSSMTSTLANNSTEAILFNATLLCASMPQKSSHADKHVAMSASYLCDNNGMLPIHYAAAYGAHVSILQALVESNPKGVLAREQNGRTPIHIAMVNAHRNGQSAISVVQFLLNYNSESRNTVNARDKDGNTPLHLLVAGVKQHQKSSSTKLPTDSNASDFSWSVYNYNNEPEIRTSVTECLNMYLDAEPIPDADFLTAVQDLPDWLRDTAVVNKHVRNVLNHKISQRFPTSILMADGIALVALIVSFARTTKNHIDLRFGDEESEFINNTHGSLVLVFVCVSYFLLREAVQFASLLSLGHFIQGIKDPSNWIDLIVIVMVLYNSILMLMSDSPSMDKPASFCTSVAFTQGTLWVAMILYLKKTLVDFAVFVGGVLYVVRRLVAFLIGVGVILFAFAQMFYFIYVETPICNSAPHFRNDAGIPDSFSRECHFPHCDFGSSLLRVYTMMIGQINGLSRYSTDPIAQLFYLAYAFVVVILLSNVLIAIVQDSYEVIQNDRAAIVFWSNRLDFIAEMDAIIYTIQHRCCSVGNGRTVRSGKSDAHDSIQKSHNADDDEHGDGGTKEELPTINSETEGSRIEEIFTQSNLLHVSPPGKKKLRETDSSNLLRLSHSTSDSQISGDSVGFLEKAWDQIMTLFESYAYEDLDLFDTLIHNIFRIVCTTVVLPLWLLVGFASAGWLWPQQVREYLFVQRETLISRAELNRKKSHLWRDIQSDVKQMKENVMKEMTEDRDDRLRFTKEMEISQTEMYDDLVHIKELIESLLVMGESNSYSNSFNSGGYEKM